MLPPDVTARVSLEAGSTFGWERYVGPKGIAIGIDEFGHSAPGEQTTWDLLLHVLVWGQKSSSGGLQLLAHRGCTAVSRCSCLPAGLHLPDLLCCVMLCCCLMGSASLHSKPALPRLLYTAARMYIWCPAFAVLPNAQSLCSAGPTLYKESGITADNVYEQAKKLL